MAWSAARLGAAGWLAGWLLVRTEATGSAQELPPFAYPLVTHCGKERREWRRKAARKRRSENGLMVK